MNFRTVLFASAAMSLASTPGMSRDLSEHEQMARDIYETVISFRTAKGHEQVPAMVDYLTGELKAAGFSDQDIEVTDYDSDGEHTQGLMVYYRSDSDAAKKPIVLLGHMDVVDALPEDWERSPFTLTEEDGYFFGRGTTDNKYGITNLVATFIRLKKEGWTPSRDLIIAFSGDEETGMISTRAQAEFVAENIDPEFVLNSDAGGGALAPDGSPLYYGVQGAEKTYATFELTVTNPGGHSSRPRDDNAIYELADALRKIEAYKFPVQASELTLAYFGAAGQVTPGEVGEAMIAFAENPKDKKAIKILRSQPETVGTTGTTCVATMLRGGHAENALPQSATATVNCRIFPGVGAAATEQKLKEIVDNDNIQFELKTDVTESPESKVRPDVLAAVTSALAARGIDVPIIPYMASGGTDGMHYRTKGYDTVAISGAWGKASDQFAHGLNERLAVDQFYAGLNHWYIVLKELAGDGVE
ncbi:M20/M25/M40 family metallo-hydrolase [Hyphococcus flavus]|uniref:M20/M25/M40 family metallo-hydrolase n=1 Tax=Hyphococcus flavus TaxID=1866326 RepID=A0AAE9ZD61_9PROT|nr:M20/M25/M40 family metallo-hydrolase [Hyphococcus flavus]WDI31385.1 M20/M25/M40 family metallo-hydrolase [Hyphococcus flavus]